MRKWLQQAAEEEQYEDLVKVVWRIFRFTNAIAWMCMYTCRGTFASLMSVRLCGCVSVCLCLSSQILVDSDVGYYPHVHTVAFGSAQNGEISTMLNSLRNLELYRSEAYRNAARAASKSHL